MTKSYFLIISIVCFLLSSVSTAANAEEEKLQFSKYSKNLQQKPIVYEGGAVDSNWRWAYFEGEVTVSGVLWIEDQAYFLIPDAKSAKILPHVIGPKYGYARMIDKLLLNKVIDYSGIPKPGSEIRGKFVRDMQHNWEAEFLTKLLGSNKATELLNNKPEVIKINVVANIKNIITTVECDKRLYGAKVVEIRLLQDTSKRMLAMSNIPKFQGC
jgi:hypothetical protein